MVDWISVFATFIALAANAATQIAIFRWLPKKGLLNSAFFGFASGLFILLILELPRFLIDLTSASELISEAIVRLITYASLAYCYFHFINLGETARRIRILTELNDSPEGLSAEEILMRYNAKEIIDRRLSRLLRNGQVAYRDNKYYVGKPVMLLAARLLIGWKSLLFVRGDAP